MSRGESKTSPRRLAAVFKAEKALELRMAGRRWQEIADALGYKTRQGPMMAVEAALKRTLQAPTDQWRALTSERLTKVLQVFWPRMLQGDEKAADRVLKAIEALSRLLGLDAPVRQVVTGEGGGPVKVAALVVTPQTLAEAIASLQAAGVLMGDGIPQAFIEGPSRDGENP